MKKKIVAGNWKMNTSLKEGIHLFEEVTSGIRDLEQTEVIVAPPFTHIASLADRNQGKIHLAAQDCSAHEKGAFTGEVSASMIASAGARYVIIGHSERRQYHREEDELLLKKVQAAFNSGLSVIFCVGETLRERQEKRHFTVVEQQLAGVLNLTGHFDRLIIAYEPVWAIGTGETATADQAQEIHHAIRSMVNVPLLYGGSCNTTNASELFSQVDVDGGLIGGASLKASDFLSIIKAAETV